MLTIVITPECPIDHEAHLIELILDGGIDRVHLRHPSATVEEMAQIIEAIPPRLYPRLSLHDCLPLAVGYALGGIHLNRRHSEPPVGFQGMISRSCHAIEELNTYTDEDYLFLSPIYDSISKTNYRSAYDSSELIAVRELLSQRVIALGGVTPDRLGELASIGFAGAALLGYVWGEGSDRGVSERIDKIKRALPQ